MKKCGKTKARNVKRLSLWFRITNRYLVYIKKGGKSAKYALLDKVIDLLR